jgi:hypothetical protein
LAGFAGAVSGLPLQQLVAPLFCQTALHFEQDSDVSMNRTPFEGSGPE